MKRAPRFLLVAGAVGALVLAGAFPVTAASPGLYFSGPASSNIYSGPPQTILTLNLPAGTWWVTATGLLKSMSSNPDTATGEVSCQIAGLDETGWSLTGINGGGGYASLFLTGVVTSTGPWPASLSCTQDILSAFVFIDTARLSALKVSTSSSPTVKSVTADVATIPTGSGYQTVGSLNLPKGKWAIVAKTNLSNPNPSAGSATTTTCRVKLSSTDEDRTGERLLSTAALGYTGEVALQVTHSFSSAGTAKLQCSKGPVQLSADTVRLVAIKAGKLTRGQFGGSSSSSGSGTPKVVTGFRTSTTLINVGSYATVASLAVPAGKWFVTAKAWLVDGSTTQVDCNLSAGAGSQAVTLYGGPEGGPVGLYLQAAADVGTAFSATLQCKSASGGPQLKYVHITAISVSSVS